MIDSRAANRARGTIEDGEETVAGRTDLTAAERFELRTHEHVVTIELITPPSITDLRHALGGGHDVGEHDRRENWSLTDADRVPVRNSSINAVRSNELSPR